MANTVKNYKVGVCRSKANGPARWLTLELVTPVGALRSVSLFFYDEAPRTRGFANDATGHLVANMRTADFDAMYHLVQTEKPVYAHWRLDHSDNSVLSIDVSTSEEPVGEGPVDHSP
jgi:hypothetical protein